MLRRYTEQIRSDSDPRVIYSVIVEANGTNARALACTCLDDAHRGHLRPCKHRQRAELAPAFRWAQSRLLRAGRLPGYTDDVDGIGRFTEAFRAGVADLVSKGRKPSQAVIDAIKDVIRAARSLPESSGGEHV